MKTYDFMRMLGERSSRVERMYYRWAKARGISYNVLAVLYVAYKDSASSQKVVCEEWGIPKQTVNTVCRDLCRDGFLRLEKSEQDGRETRLVLTEKGIRMAQPIVTELLDIETSILDSMGPEAIGQLLDLFQHFCSEAEKRLLASAQEHVKTTASVHPEKEEKEMNHNESDCKGY